MSVLSDARQALVELPISDILRERLNLAFDYAASLERKITELQSQTEALHVQLERITLDRDQARQETQTLKELASAPHHLEISKDHERILLSLHEQGRTTASAVAEQTGLTLLIVEHHLEEMLPNHVSVDKRQNASDVAAGRTTPFRWSIEHLGRSVLLERQ